MDTRLTTTQGMWRLLTAAIIALALMVTLGATSATTASPTICRVKNTDTGRSYKALQTAVDAARKGDRLTVRGTCVGGTVIGTKLVLEGTRTTTSGKPTLSGAGKSRVVTITKGVRVRMRSVEIVRGSSPKGMSGGGILNQGTLTLIDVVVRGNRAHGSGGGGIYNAGTLTIGGSSHLLDNRAPAGGGVYNAGTLTMNDAATISRNGMVYDVPTLGSGGGVLNRGTLTMNDSSAIHHNSAGGGGGVSNWATMTMNDSSTIHDNTGDGGGGVWSYLGTITMNDSSAIHDNTAGWSGGVSNGGTFTMNDSSVIHDNTGDGGGGVSNDYGDGIFAMNGSSAIHSNNGVGVNNDGSFTMNDSSAIHTNNGGGVFNQGDLTMSGASSIHDNKAKVGGGIVDLDGTHRGVICAPEAGANVYSNTPRDCDFDSLL